MEQGELTISNEPTIMELNHWYTHIFEKYGWMFLCLVKDNDQKKFYCYKNMVDKFIIAVQNKIKNCTNTSDPHCQDLTIMKNNVELFYKKAFPSQAGGKKRAKKRGSKKGSKKGSRKGSKK